jgi:hypothetical protein
MGFRFFKRIQILPGLTLNLSKTGASLSAGVRGAHVTVSPKGIRQTVGLPGSGIFYTEYEKHGGQAKGESSEKHHIVQALTGNNSMLFIIISGIIGFSALFMLGLGSFMPFLIVAFLYFAWKKGGTTQKVPEPDPYEVIDKRLITASGEPKYSEAEIEVIIDSSNALVTLVSTSLTVANESTDYDIRVLHTKNATDALATLQKYTEIYPGMSITNLDEIKYTVEMLEVETRSLTR